MGWTGVRANACVVAACAAAVAVSACSLFTDFGGATGGAADASPAGTDASSSDATASADGTTSSGGLDASGDTTINVGPDGGLPPGVLSKDSFDTSCSSWTPYNATIQPVSEAYAGTGSCKVCLTQDGVGGGIKHTYSNVGPGMYLVSARVKNVSATDARITIVRELDGGLESHYATKQFLASTNWLDNDTATSGDHLYEVDFWFGDTYLAGDCALIDEVTVRVEQ